MNDFIYPTLLHMFILQTNMLRRPKPGECDLEDMMKEFVKNPTPASTTLVNKRKPDSAPEQEIKKTKSVFARQRGESKTKPEPAPEMVNLSVLSEIVEKNSSTVPVPPCLMDSTGFPEIFKLDKTRGGSGENKKSLFSQKFLKMKQSFSHTNTLSLQSQNPTAHPVRLIGKGVFIGNYYIKRGL